MKFLTLFFSAAFFVQFVAAIPGGWTKADPKSAEILNAVRFAVDTKFPGTSASFKTISAMKQVR
jgi:hypothetical protein